MTTLDLGANQLYDGPPNEFSNLTSLKVVNLSDNDLGGVFPGFWSAVSSLSVLDLGGNNFYGPAPPGFSSLENLRHLNLSANGGCECGV